MNLKQVISHVDRTLARMNTGFGMPLFDEWILFEAGGSTDRILHYQGPRSESLQRQFLRDLQPLMEELRGGQYDPGHYYFSREGHGAQYDAFICVGQGVYAIVNNTAKSMAEITADPLWRTVQSHFVDLSERLRADPLR
jgi:hypothetical protein